MSNISINASIFELSIYCGYSIIGALVYAQGGGLEASKTIKSGSVTIKLVLKNKSVYVTADTSTLQMTVALKNIFGGHTTIMESSDDDLSSPTKIIEF